MEISLGFLSQGLVLGLAAGILPGPVMMFIFGQVLKKGVIEGIKVQIGASLFDILRIGITYLLFSYIPQEQNSLGLISLVGGIFLLYMAYGNFIFKPNFQETKSELIHPVLQGVLGNILNPHPYIFWLTVGGHIILAANSSGSKLSTILFGFGFLMSVFGISAAVTVFTGKLKTYVSSKYYTYTIRALGLVLVFFAYTLFKQAYLFMFK